jgi:EAL domain-containing protein (putative c-di-GMP-specific phosphodiesterase class I)
LRWMEISRGWIEPRDDIRIQSGTGEPLTSGRYVLQAAARDIHQWRSAGVTPAAVSVQFAVSLTSFDDARTGLQHAGEAWQVGPETLQIELSVESVLDSRTGRIYRDVVTLWRQLGLPIVVRRWGARRGVHPVPMLDGVDALKLDVRLVNEIDLFPAARETLSELMEQAASKGIPVIAEGVDRWRQLETLRAVDCHLAQGPLLLHAVAGPEVPDLLRAGVFRIRVPDALELTDELPALPGSQA